MWGALENLNMISMGILVKQAPPEEEAELSARISTIVFDSLLLHSIFSVA
jgi:hypothetical protein